MKTTDQEKNSSRQSRASLFRSIEITYHDTLREIAKNWKKFKRLKQGSHTLVCLLRLYCGQPKLRSEISQELKQIISFL